MRRQTMLGKSYDGPLLNKRAVTVQMVTDEGITQYLPGTTGRTRQTAARGPAAAGRAWRAPRRRAAVPTSAPARRPLRRR
jgi:hypothetical protein